MLEENCSATNNPDHETEHPNGSDEELRSLSLHPDHLVDLVRSGLSAETIQAAKIHSVPPRESTKCTGDQWLPLEAIFEL